MRQIKRTMLVAALAVLAGGAAWAQSPPSFDKEFDASAPLAVKGTIVMVEPMQPSSWIFVKAAGVDNAGKAVPGATSTWAFRAADAAYLLQAGVSEDVLAVGKEVSVQGYLAKNRTCAMHPVIQAETCKAAARTLTTPNGCKVFVGQSGTGAPQDGADPKEGGAAATCKPA